MNLSWRVEVLEHARAPVQLVRVSGVLDDTFDSSSFAGPRAGHHLLVDLDAARVPAGAVRAWHRSFRRFSLLSFIRCRPATLALFNRIDGFACGGQLVSFYGPYACPRPSHRTFDHLIDLRYQYDVVTAHNPPPAQCPACGEVAQFDDDPLSFFSYAATLSPPQLPSEAAELTAVYPSMRPAAPDEPPSLSQQLQETRRQVAAVQERLDLLLGVGPESEKKRGER